MKVFNWNDVENQKIPHELISSGCGISIGCFDGLHQGHQKLLLSLIQNCQINHYSSCVITFSKPLGNLSKDKFLGDILTFEERIKKISEIGIDFCIIINIEDFVSKIQQLDGIDFIKYIEKNLNLKLIVEGLNFRCGYKGSTDIIQIEKYCTKNNIKSIFIDPVFYENLKISSSEVRKALKDGNISLANKLLGYEYESVKFIH